MLKQTFLINTDLKMGKGKIAVQVAHGEVFYMMEKYTGHQYGQLYDNFINWTTDGLMKKVVLKSTEKEMSNITWDLKTKISGHIPFSTKD